METNVESVVKKIKYAAGESGHSEIPASEGSRLTEATIPAHIPVPVETNPEMEASSTAAANIEAIHEEERQHREEGREEHREEGREEHRQEVRPVVGQAVPVIVDVTTHFNVSNMTRDDKIATLTHCVNIYNFAEFETVKSLIQLYIFELNREESAEVIANVDQLRALIHFHCAEKAMSLADVGGNDTERVRQIRMFSNILSIADSLVETRSIRSYDDLRNDNETEGTRAISKFDENFADYCRLLDGNEVFSSLDKKRRQLEYYRAYESEIESECNKERSSKTEFSRLLFRKRIRDLKSEIDTIEARVVALKEQLEVLNTRRQAAGISQAAIQNLDASINDIQGQLDAYISTQIKKNIFAMDGKVDEVRNWASDETLESIQIEKVREIDRYLLSKATNEYKDKLFMQQIMGCTVRQRLAIYLCVEQDVDKMDDAKLLFSQTNYLPDLETIKSEMRGYSILRRIGWKRGHWSKLRRAYEYVTSNSDLLNDIADVALEEHQIQSHIPARNGERQGDVLDLGNARQILTNSTETTIEEADKNVVHSRIVELSGSIMRQLEVYKKTSSGLNEIDANLITMRNYVDRAIELSNGSESIHWKRFRKTLEFTNKWYTSKLPYVGAVESAARLHKSFGDTVVSSGFDMVNGVTSLVNPFLTLGQEIYDTVEMISNWNNKSFTGNAKDFLKFAGGANKLASTYTFITKGIEDGFEPTKFTAKRLAASKKISDSIAEHSVNEKFGSYAFSETVQIIGSFVTLASSTIDLVNAGSMKNRSTDIRGAFRRMNHRNAESADFKRYRRNTHLQAVANLADRIANRKIASSLTNIVTDGAGYIKYFVGWLPLGGVVSLSTFGVKMLMAGVDKLLKRRSDYKTVDEFLDLDGQIAAYNAPVEVDKTTNEFRNRFRKKIMLQLGFANTKTFFKHVASKFGTMIHRILSGARTKHESGRPYTIEEKFVDLVKAMELNVNIPGNIIPPAEKIAAKLSQ